MDDHRDAARFVPWQPKIWAWPEVVLWFTLLIIPLVIGLVWGTFFDESAYVTFRSVRNLAAGRGLIDTRMTVPTLSGAEEGQTLSRVRCGLESPLYTLALLLLAGFKIPLPSAALIWSALGWGATAMAIYATGRRIARPVAAAVAATLVVFSPVVVSTLGTEVSWAVALTWMAIASSARKRWAIQTSMLVLLLYTHFDLSTLTVVMLLLVMQWIERKRFPVWFSLVLAIAVLGWGVLAAWRVVTPFSLPLSLAAPRLNLVEWGRDIQRLVDESEFYWLFLPFIGGGLVLSVASRHKALWAGYLVGIVSIWGGGAVAGAMMVTLGLFLTGLAMDWVVKWIEGHDLLRLDRLMLAVSVMLVGGLPLGVAQASSLFQRYPFRPAVRQELEQQVGNWLRTQSEPAALLLASERVGYLADRPTLSWEGSESDQAGLDLVLDVLSERPPAYCVSFRSLAWDRLVRTGWFQDEYVPLQRFESPYDAASPFTIWGQRPRAFDLGEYQPLSMRLPGQVYGLGYKYGPDRIRPGDTVHVTLFLQAMQSQTMQRFDEAFQPVVRMTSPHYGAGWTQIAPIEGISWVRRATIASRSVLVDSQQMGQVVAVQFVLTQTSDVSVGAYYLDVSVVGSADSRTPLSIYRHKDSFPVDRIVLGHVVVPWRDEAQQAVVDAAKPAGADFGNQIHLLGFDAADTLLPGAPYDVRLYWEARQPPEGDYVVFVHLLDANGQKVASHDAPPVNGRYPTKTWLPGEIVPDVHRLVFNRQISEGTYQLFAGMYRWPSMERLPVWDGQGIEQPDQALALQFVQVR